MNKQKGDAVLVVLGGMLVIVVVGLTFFDHYGCHKRSSMMGLRASWGPVQGCMVKVGSRWAPLEYIRIVDDKVIIQGDGEG